MKDFCRFIAHEIIPYIAPQRNEKKEWTSLKKHVKKMEKQGLIMSEKDKIIIDGFIKDPNHMLLNPPDLKENNTQILQSLEVFSKISDLITDNNSMMACVCKTIHILAESNPAVPVRVLRKASIYVRLLGELYKQHPSI